MNGHATETTPDMIADSREIGWFTWRPVTWTLHAWQLGDEWHECLETGYIIAVTSSTSSPDSAEIHVPTVLLRIVQPLRKTFHKLQPAGLGYQFALSRAEHRNCWNCRLSRGCEIEFVEDGRADSGILRVMEQLLFVGIVSWACSMIHADVNFICLLLDF